MEEREKELMDEAVKLLFLPPRPARNERGED